MFFEFSLGFKVQGCFGLLRGFSSFGFLLKVAATG